MPDYVRMYCIMFNAANEVQRLAVKASAILREAKEYCEELCMEPDDPPIIILYDPSNDESAGD